MAIGGNKRSQISTTPQGLNVQKFAESRSSELETLHSIVADRLNNNFRSRRNKRRRTTAHNNLAANNRCRKRHKLGVVDKNNPLDLGENQKKVPRHVRRRVKLRENPKSGFCTSGDGTRWLRTHVWHAKRFTMTKLWGFHLPLGLQGRGKGSRALLKLFRQGVLLHDASYYGAVQLEGPEDSLMSVLRRVLVPSPSVFSEDTSNSVLSGDIYGSAMLHHGDAPVSQPIAPVSYMWRPLDQQSRGSNTKEHIVDGSNESQGIESCSPFRQLWVWIHASAFSEGYNVLKFSCQNEMNERGLLINCISLEGQLGKLEVTGAKSFQLLQKTLQHHTCIESSWQFDKQPVEEADGGSQLKKSPLLDNEEHISSQAILSFTVKDPRTLSQNNVTHLPELTSSSMLTDVLENESHPTSWSKPEEKCILSDNKDLWDAIMGAIPPVEEHHLSMEKHSQRRNSFCLDNPNSGEMNTSKEGQCSRSCPILILKNNDKTGIFIGWSIILPLSWIRAFWVPLVSKGARAIGLREKHWIASEVGLPYFPLDFPDCNACSSFMATKVADSNEKAELCPPAVRPFKVPISPPWDTVRFAFEKGHNMEGDSQGGETTCTEDPDIGNSSSKSDCVTSDTTSTDITVARTSSALTYLLNKIEGYHLLSIAQEPDKKTSLLKFMDGENKLGCARGGITLIKHHPRLYFLRVLVYAYKEGAFEDGAVVCAPYLTDISCWTNRTADSEGGLQMPMSSVRSYFKEQSDTKWVIQVPEDPVARESHRWPIGFVTTGFVRGSKKPLATAFCEATLLARLRDEQWSKFLSKQRKKEIYVLVRNLRSSAYRLALATIVLERQKDDVKFM